MKSINENWARLAAQLVRSLVSFLCELFETGRAKTHSSFRRLAFCGLYMET